MAAVRRPSCFHFMRAELSDCLFGFGDPLSLVQISFVDQEGFDYFVVQRRFVPNMIHSDLESGSDLLARTLFDGGGLIDRLRCLTFRRL
jgi:hypothetical protein